MAFNLNPTNPIQIVADQNYTVYAVFAPAPAVPTPTPSTSTIPPGPSPTPSTSTIPPGPSPTPSITPTPSPTPSITPTPSKSAPAPTPSPSPKPSWRDCVTGKLANGYAPTAYVEVPYSGLGGGTCWEPASTVGFVPPLDSLSFTYKRNSANYPAPIQVVIQNPSYGLSYEVKLTTDNRFFTINPSLVMVPPRQNKPFTISIIKKTINNFVDGQTPVGLDVEITER